MEKNISDKKKKVKKPKGPIRTGLITFLVVFAAGIFIYTKFFLDTHLRWGMQAGLTYANHAEVNVREVKTSFSEASLKIRGIEITDFDNPAFNSLRVGEVSFNLLWDALLRFKLVVPKSKMTGLSFNEKRKSPGRIYPKRKAEAEKEESVLTKEAKKEAEEIVDDNVLGDVAKLLEGGDFKQNLKEVKFDLKSEKRIKELETLIDEKKVAWKDDVEEIKNLDKLNAVIQKAKNIKFDKDPLKAAKQLKELSKLKKEADGHINNYKSKVKGLKEDYKSLSNSIGEVDDLIKEDNEALKDHFKIPKVDFSEISQKVFRKYVMSTINPYLKYWYMVKAKIPKKQKDHKKDLTPHERAKGVNYAFPITKGYPLFWLKRLDISSSSKVSQGDQKTLYQLEGFVTDASSNEKIVGRPMVMKLSGDAPAKNIQGISFDATVSDKTGKYQAEVLGKVASFPVDEVKLSNSSKLKLSLTNSRASTEVRGTLGLKEADLNLKTVFNSIQWKLSAENEKTGKILNGIFAGIPEVDLKGRIRGSLLKPRIKISSNFDEQFKDGISSYVSGKIDEAKNKVKNMIDDKIGASKARLLGKLGDTEKGYLKPLLDGDKKLSDAGGIFDQIKKDQESKAKNAVKSKGKAKVKKELDKLKSKLKLPF